MESLQEFMDRHRADEEKSESFVDYLYALLQKHGVDNPADFYNKANISRQLWSSIVSGKSHPSLNVCLKMVFAMKANNHECKYLLKKAGFTLASSSPYALIIRYAIENGIYDVLEVNRMLEENGCGDSLIV